MGGIARITPIVVLQDPHDTAITWCLVNGQLYWNRCDDNFGWWAVEERALANSKTLGPTFEREVLWAVLRA